MVGSCIAPGCSNYYSPHRHVSYFRFPNPSKYPELHKAWLRAMQLSNVQPSKHSCICELHFNEEDYDETYKMKKMLMPSDYFRPILKPGAVPKLELQGVGSKDGETGEKAEILRELLGDSYLKWKRTANVKVEKLEDGEERGSEEFYGGLSVVKMESVENDFEEGVDTLVVPKDEVKVEDGVEKKQFEVIDIKVEHGDKKTNDMSDIEANTESQKEKFDITRDFVMKQPLKPLPAELQRIIPSILSVIIKEAPSDKSIPKPPKIQTKPKQHPCMAPLTSKQFHHCHQCNFTTFLKINVLNHTRTAHCLIKTQQIERLPMKIFKHKEPKSYTCGNCNFTTHSRLVLLKHAYRTKEYNLLEQLDVKWFKCEFCAYKSRRSRGLKIHLGVKHGLGDFRQQFKCDRCEYSNAEETNLRKHFARQHLCVDLCVGHMQKHCWFRCLYCDYATSKRHVLHRHILSKHTSDGEPL